MRSNRRYWLIATACFVISIFCFVMGAQAPAPKAPATTLDGVCWPTSDADPKVNTCVPISVLRGTFPTYTAGDVSPLHSTSASLINVQRQLLGCQGKLLDGAEQSLVSALNAAAPAGLTVDLSSLKYLKPDPPKANPAPTVPATK